jgi:hypothetical protein
MPEYVDVNGYRFYWLNPRNASDLLQGVSNRSVDALYLSRTNGVDDALVRAALAMNSNLRAVAFGLTVDKNKRYDLSILTNLPQLEYVSWDEPPTKPVRLGALKRLRKAAISWSPKVLGLSELDELVWLRLARYKPKSGGFDELASHRTLEEMHLVQGSFRDLSALSRFEKLKCVSISYVRAAMQLDSLTSKSLESLELDRCSRTIGQIRRHQLPALNKVWGSSAPHSA